MGRNRDDYWYSRRAAQARRAVFAYMTAPRAFDHQAVIEGAHGRVCLEAISEPPTDTPLAAWRVLARWTGFLLPESVITVGDRSMVVLRVRPMAGRRTVAHILCRESNRKELWGRRQKGDQAQRSAAAALDLHGQGHD